MKYAIDRVVKETLEGFIKNTGQHSDEFENETAMVDWIVENQDVFLECIGFTGKGTIRRNMEIVAGTGLRADLMFETDTHTVLIEVKASDTTKAYKTPVYQCAGIGQLLCYQAVAQYLGKPCKLFLVDSRINIHTINVVRSNSLPITLVELTTSKVGVLYAEKTN